MYSQSVEDHWKHLWEVLDTLRLDTLRRENLYVKFFKYEFWLREVQFLEQIVGADGIKVDPTKIVTIRE